MKKKYLLLIAGGLLISSGSALAKSGCDINVGKMNMDASIQAQAKKMTENKDLLTDFKKPGSTTAGSDPFGIDALNSCLDSWPSGGFNFQIPTLDSVIKGVGDAAVSKACGLARDKVGSAVSGISGDFRVPSTIPGLPSIGVSGGVGSGGSSISDIASGNWSGMVNNNASSAASSISQSADTVADGWKQVQGLFN